MRLGDARAIVTGAARGLGRHFTLALLRAGARVAAVDINGAGLRALRAEAAAPPGALTVAAADIADEAAVTAFVAQAAADLDGLNLLINNAGVLRDGLLVVRDGEAVRRLPAALWKKVIDVNLTGQFLMTREVAARMIESGTRGVIVNISSLARAGNPGQSAYAAAKAGLDACTRTWALELAPHGIRVGGVAPGVIDTPILADVSDEAMASLLAAIPLGKLGTPEEVWEAVQLILTCEFLTGRTVEIDGGARMG
jgi:3-oxoacyl-[acyl-carrier protein] reductase